MDVHRNKEEEQDIAAGIKNGDTRALIRWNNHYFKVFTHFTFQITQDREAAESIVSETFLKIWSLRLNFNTIHDIKAFTYTTCRNEAYNYVRDRESKRRKELLYGDLEELTGNAQPEQDAKKEEEQEAEAAYIRSVMYDRMLQQIDQLPPKRRQIIRLLLKGKDNAEVAKKLKISQAAVREAKMKAIEQIKKSLKDGKIILLSLLLIFK